MRIWKLVFFLLILTSAAVWLAVFAFPKEDLKIVACDVGQGDAILIEKGKGQILIDGGPGDKVIDCLSQHMAFWDREIEVVILTHPQKDHYGGLVDVFQDYKVDYFLANGLDSSSPDYQVLKSLVRGRGVEVVNTVKGQQLRLGLIYLDILHPTEAFLAQNNNEISSQNNVLGAYTTNLDPNEYSVVALLSYGNFDALFTGDLDPANSDKVADIISGMNNNHIEYIKIPHHGSRNGISEKLLNVVNPDIAVISVGRKNTYGHPHPEVIKLLKDKGVKILRTDEMGSIVIESDGEKTWIRN